MHIGTGNYNPKTARLYTDLGLFTADPEIGADVAEMFNSLTGYARPRSYRKVLVAPFNLQEGLLARDRADDRVALARDARADPDEDELAARRAVDPRALPRLAGRACEVELNVRGICGLRPGVPGVSENIRVVSVVGPLPGALAHLLLRAPRRGRDVYIGSADLMPRNLYNRVELVAPILTTRRFAPSSSTCSTARSPTTPTPGCSARTAAGPGGGRTASRATCSAS